MLLWHKNHYGVRSQFESSFSVHKHDSTKVTSGFKFPKNSDRFELDNMDEFSIIGHEAVRCSVDYPTNSLTCSKEELAIIPDAFGNQTLHENLSTETGVGASYVIQPRILRKENLEGYSSNLKQIVLSYEEWKKIRPQFGDKKLHSEWTNIISKKIEFFNPLCVLKFSYHIINLKSNRRDCHFVLGEGKCKFENCITFRLWIKSEPEGTNDVNFLTYGSISNQHNDNKTAFSRHLSGEIRQEVSTELSKSSPINCYYEQFNESKNLFAAKHGNFNNLHSQALLRKIKPEHLSKKRYDCDM